MKIEEYLNSLDKKELIYLFLSIPIVIFMIYYNFVYPKLIHEKSKLQKQITKKEKELRKLHSEISVVKLSGKLLKPTKQKLASLKDDFKYIEYSFDTLEIVKLDNPKVYRILTNLLDKSKQLSLNVTLNIKWNNVTIKPYNQYIEVDINGIGNYISIIKYIQFIDYIKSITFIKDIKIVVNDKDKIKSSSQLQFFITLSIVGVK